MSEPAVIGVDLGGTNVRAGLVADGRLVEVRTAPVRSRGSAEDVLEDLFGAVDPLVRDDVAGIGAGVPSVIDLEAGVVYDVQNIPAWKKVPLRARLERRYRLPVSVNNDANAFAAGEKRFGKMRPYASGVGLIVGTGLGAGVVAGGRLYSGANCGAGEFGMIRYLDGSFEAYASGQFFERVHGVSGRELAARAERGEGRALEIFAEFGGHVGEALKAICYAVDPEIVVLGGSVSKSFRFFEAAMREAFATYAYSLARERLRIEVSETEHIAVLGAAALYLEAASARVRAGD